MSAEPKPDERSLIPSEVGAGAEVAVRGDPVDRALRRAAPRACAAARPGARARRSRTRSRRRGSAPRARASRAAPPAGAGSRSGSGGTRPSARPPVCPFFERRRHIRTRVTANEQQRGVQDRARAERGQDDVAPARRARAPAARSPSRAGRPRATISAISASPSAPPPESTYHLRLLDRGRDALLERREPRGVRRPVRGDLRAELAQPLPVGIDDGVDHLGDRLLERRRAPRSGRPASAAGRRPSRA